MMSRDLLQKADKLKATPIEDRPKSISEKHKGEPWLKQIYHGVKDAMNMTPEYKRQMTENFTAQRAEDIRPTLEKIQNVAEKIHTDSKATREKIQPDLGNTGKAVSFATQLIPGVRAMDTVVSTGENKNIHDGVITAIANRVIPGSAAAAPGVSAATTAAKDLALKVTQQAAPEAVKSARDAVVPPSKTSASMPDPFVEAKSEDKGSPLLKPLKKPA